MLARSLDDIIFSSHDTTSTFRSGDPMDTMNHDNHHNNADRGNNNNGLNSFSQAPMFTAEQLQAMHRQSQQQQHRNNPLIPNQSSGTIMQQQQYSSSMNDSTNQNWMQMLQPTPLLGNTLQNPQPNANHSSSSNNNNGMEMQFMLQQLFQNQQTQGGNNNINNDMKNQATSLFTLGSTVEPMHRSMAESDPDADFFKSMWDEDSALPAPLGKPPSFQPSKAATKRKWTVRNIYYCRFQYSLLAFIRFSDHSISIILEDSRHNKFRKSRAENTAASV